MALGCQTTVVDDANLGLQAAAREKPDLILLAIELPRMNGFSVCNKLKRDAALKDVPLIIMSSDSTEETFEQHRRLRTRAEDYLHKPIGFDALLARIQPFVRIGDPGSAPEQSSDSGDLGSDAAIVLDDDIEIEEAVAEVPEVESTVHESGVDQDVSDFADQAFGALEAAPPSALPDSEVLIDELEIAEPEIAEPEIAEPQTADPESAEPELAEPELAQPPSADSESAEPELAEPQSADPESAEAEVTRRKSLTSKLTARRSWSRKSSGPRSLSQKLRKRAARTRKSTRSRSRSWKSSHNRCRPSISSYWRRRG